MVMRDIVARKLKSNDFEVLLAMEGKTGLDMILKERPDLIVLDLMLPELDGFQILENLRSQADQKLAATPVVVLSNLYSNSQAQKAKSYNVQAYMVKAYYTTEEILEKIQEVLKAQETPSGAN